MTDLVTLQARIAARRARDLEMWQSRQPRTTGHCCAHCGNWADATLVDKGAPDEPWPIRWTCKRCRTEAPEPKPAMLTVPEAAEELGCSVSLLRQATDMPVVRFGRHVRVDPDALWRWWGARDDSKRRAR